MRKTETLFIGTGLILGLVVAGTLVWRACAPSASGDLHQYPTTKYGAFLAAQHAVAVNDFKSADEFMGHLDGVDYDVVNNSRMISQFLNGRVPENAKLLQNEKNLASGIIYDAYLLENDNWDELYRRHKKDASALSAPLRIWSSVATGHASDAIKYIDTLPSNASWKSFMRGQIYAQAGDIDAAAAEFANVGTDFLNISDYLYLMSFYLGNNMPAAAAQLRADFVALSGGMYLSDYDAFAPWETYVGSKNALAFSLIQTVSHTQVMMYSDLAVLLIQFAHIIGPMYAGQNDAINYYLGQYYYTTVGDYQACFDRISPDSPFYLFGVLRVADKTNDFSALASAVRDNPLFVPGAMRLIAHYVSNGDASAAHGIVSRALKSKSITDAGRAHFLKSRAAINFAFGNLKDAQADIRLATDAALPDGEILALQAKIWAAQNREIETAYEYAMQLVRNNPTDVVAWDTLGRVIAAREGPAAALDLTARVGEVSGRCSSLFESIGDQYAALGDMRHARDAYLRAIDLADDGMVVIPHLRKKIKALK